MAGRAYPGRVASLAPGMLTGIRAGTRRIRAAALAGLAAWQSVTPVGPAAGLATQHEAAEQAREHAWTARLLLVGFVAVRLVHLSQGYLDLATGWHAYRIPAVAAAVVAGATADSVWMITRSWRLGRLDPLAIRMDALFGATALLLLGTAMWTTDRTTSLNWMLPYTVGTAVAAGLTLRARAALPLSAGLAVVYLASVWPDVVRGHGAAATAIVNAVSYLGFLCVAAVLRTVLFHLVDLLGQARGEAVVRGEQLAAERERARQHRLIHDSALQTLEAVANGWGGGGEQLRQRARRESQRLRLALSEGDPGGGHGLRDRLGLIVTEFAGRGLNIEYVHAELTAAAPDEVTGALAEATREALTNVIKHSGVTAAVVRAASCGDGIELSVLDRGRGFDTGLDRPGFGITNSIRGRLTEVGGRAEIRSAPGEGTLVRLWSPA